MNVTVFHINHDAPGYDHSVYALASMPRYRDEGDDVTKRDDAVLRLFARGAYKEVAKVECQTLDDAYLATQNGIRTPSWSMLPLPGVTPAGEGVHWHNLPVAKAEQRRQEYAATAKYLSQREREGIEKHDKLRDSLTTFVWVDGVRHERQPFGYKSSSTGDLFRNDETGEMFVFVGQDFDKVA